VALTTNYSDWANIDQSSRLLRINRIRYIRFRRREIDAENEENIQIFNQDPDDLDPFGLLEENLPLGQVNEIMAHVPSYAGHILNDELFTNFYHAKFYLIRDLQFLADNLLRTDYSVVDSRRQAHVWLNEFLASGVFGEELFNDNDGNNQAHPALRFRSNGRADTFVSDLDGNFYATLNALASVLSYRSTTVAKDTGAAIASGGKQASEKMELATDSACQDNTKRFETLKQKLKTFTRNGSHTIDRAIFERKVATWQ